jgi:hypothetical protein
MGLVPSLGKDNGLCMRGDRGRATRVRYWGGLDPEPLEFGGSPGRRIRLPIQ